MAESIAYSRRHRDSRPAVQDNIVALDLRRNVHPAGELSLMMGNSGAQNVSEINRAYVATPDWKTWRRAI
jgi:hypothetical protein